MPETLYIGRIFPDKVRCDEIDRRLDKRVRAGSGVGGFSPTADPFIGVDPNEQPGSSSIQNFDRVDLEDFDTGDFTTAPRIQSAGNLSGRGASLSLIRGA